MVNKCFFAACLFVAFSPACFAGLLVSPTALDVNLCGGNSVERMVVVSGDFSVPASVSLSSVVSSESGDTNGFSVLFEPESFVLLPGQPFEVKLFFSAVSNIAPEKYVVRLEAVASVEETLPPPVVQQGDGGGGRWVGRSVPLPGDVDVNVTEAESVVVPKPVVQQVERDAQGCNLTLGFFWCEALQKCLKEGENCEKGGLGEPIAIKPVLPTGFWALTPLFRGLFASVFTLVLLGFFTGLLFLFKKEKTKKEANKNG